MTSAYPVPTQAVDGTAGAVHQSDRETSVSGEVVESFANSATCANPQVKVQLRPVGNPSPVTQLFEYTLKAWDFQKGDHCTYKYLPSRDPTAPMEMYATVLVRLPHKQALLIRDPTPRVSRVQAQNAVAQLALESLATEDPELASSLEAIRQEQQVVPPPAPPAHFHRFQSSPPTRWRNYPANQYDRGMYNQQPFYGYPPSPYYVHRSTSAPEEMAEQAAHHHMAPPPPISGDMMYYASPQMDEQAEAAAMVSTPTLPHYQYNPYGYHPMTPQGGWPAGGFGQAYPPAEMMYYPPMMMVPPPTMMPATPSGYGTPDKDQSDPESTASTTAVCH